MKHTRSVEPFECAYCSNYFVSNHYFILTLFTGEQFGICEKCALDLACDRCNKKIISSELYVEECTICEKIYLVCSKCRKVKKPFFTEIKDIFKRFLLRYGFCGITTTSDSVKCCINQKEMPLKFASILYFRKKAEEGTDKEKQK
ncbi:MAG: hypothetical protein KAI43_10840 [Candidatus Aureabacteria bacterium]|nr:hypothetical protein [Candidatus Auribacterota bacterium]